MSARDLIEASRLRIDQHLKQFFPDEENSRLSAAMKYSLFGGKRIRGCLAIESARLFGIEDERPLQTAGAIECIHAYSLIHDDLPCMDDDSMRRGKPTAHVKFGEALAILAGDALQNLAFEILSNAATSPDAEVRVVLIGSLAKAAGHKGMLLGQDKDIEASDADHAQLDVILSMLNLKTATLICWSAQSGAILAKQHPTPLKTFGANLGMAYQIIDDCLDEEPEGDESQNIVRLIGFSEAQKLARQHIDQACSALNVYGPRSKPLCDIAELTLTRK